MKRKMRFLSPAFLLALLLAMSTTVYAAGFDLKTGFQLGPQGPLFPCNITQMVQGYDHGTTICGNPEVPDWSTLFDYSSRDSGRVSAAGDAFLKARGITPVVAVFMEDQTNSHNDTVFAAGNKLGQLPDIDWHWKFGNANSKQDIMDAYAYGITDPVNGNLIIYCGVERLGNNGDSHFDFEFNEGLIEPVMNGAGLTPQQAYCVTPDSTANPFSGKRTSGDLLVSFDFTQGGRITDITVQKWDDTAKIFVDQGIDPATDTRILAFGNFSTIPTHPTPLGDYNSWVVDQSTCDGTKSLLDSLAQGEFAEVGIDVDALGFSHCFKTMQVHSHESASIGSNMTDFVMGPFDTCSALTIIKSAKPVDNTQDFNFDVNGTVFTLHDPPSQGFSNQTTFSNLVAGTYTATEHLADLPKDPPRGWAFVNVTCFTTSGNNATVNADQVNATADVIFASAGDVTCVFKNQQLGSITVRKDTLPSGGCTSQAFDFELTNPNNDKTPFSLCGANSNLKDFDNLLPGNYCVSETSVPSGWQFVNLDVTPSSLPVTLSDEGKTACFTLVPGASLEFNYTNQKPPTLKIKKDCGTSCNTGSTEFIMTVHDTTANTNVATPSLTCGQTSDAITLTAGHTYTITETVPDCWSLDTATLDGTPLDITSHAVTITPKAGDDNVLTMTNSKKGTIKVAKVSTPTGASFNFTVKDPNGNIIVNSQPVVGGAVATDFGLGCLPAGKYTVIETLPALWTLSNIGFTEDCTTDSTSDVPTATATVNLQPGENVVVTFTDIQLATLKIKKDCGTSCNAGTPAFIMTVHDTTTNTDVATPSLTCGQTSDTITLTAGHTYTITETLPSCWSLDSAALDGTPLDITSHAVTITPKAGDNNVLTMTNSKKGTIKVAKVSTPTGESFNFTVKDPNGNIIVNSQPVVGGAAATDFGLGCLPAGKYTVIETVPAHWTLNNIGFTEDCTADSTSNIPTATATVNLQPGENVVVTFTDSKLASFHVVKATLPNPDPTKSSFGFSSPGLTPATFSLQNGGKQDFTDLAPGTYCVTEDVLSGCWKLTAVSGSDNDTTAQQTGNACVTLNAGDDKTVTFTNTLSGRVVVKKSCTSGSGTFTFNFSPSLNGVSSKDISCGGSFDSGCLSPGTYHVTEVVPIGWELDSVSVTAVHSDGTSSTVTIANGAAFTVNPGDNVTVTFNDSVPGQGCSPGYWKNHTKNWPAPYSPNELFVTAFYGITFPSDATKADKLEIIQASLPCYTVTTGAPKLLTLTMSGALGLKGGGLLALTRQAASALLNSREAELGKLAYPFTTTASVVDFYSCAYCGTCSSPISLGEAINVLNIDNTLFCPGFQ